MIFKNFKISRFLDKTKTRLYTQDQDQDKIKNVKTKTRPKPKVKKSCLVHHYPRTVLKHKIQLLASKVCAFLYL